MRKLITLILLAILTVSNFASLAQVSNFDEIDAYKSWQTYNALLDQNTSSKTTNNVKVPIAFSCFINNLLADSVRVIEPYLGGYCKFNLSSCLSSFSINPDIRLFKNMIIEDYSNWDYLTAIKVIDTSGIVDTIRRSYSSNGQAMTSNFYNHFVGNSEQINDSIHYTYDSQGRISTLYHHHEARSFNPNEEYTRIKNYSYSPNLDYINVNSALQRYNGTETSYDSIAISNNQVSALYRYSSFGLLDSTIYTYYSLNPITFSAKTYQVWGVSQELFVAQKQGSDFPDSVFSYSDGSAGGPDGSYKYKLHFDSNTGFLVRIDRKFESNVDPEFEDYYDISTDSDGDITKIIGHDLPSGSIWIKYNYYYGDSTNSLNYPNTFDADIHAFPVPSSDVVKINSSELFDGYALYDISGKLLQSSSFSKSLESRVDLSSYSSGVYFLEIFSDGKKNTVTLEKQ